MAGSCASHYACPPPKCLHVELAVVRLFRRSVVKTALFISLGEVSWSVGLAIIVLLLFLRTGEHQMTQRRSFLRHIHHCRGGP